MDQRSSDHQHLGKFAADSPQQRFSLLRLSVPARLVIVGTIAVLLWVLVWLWALA